MKTIIRSLAIAALLSPGAFAAEQRAVAGKPPPSGPGTLIQGEALLSRAQVKSGAIGVKDMHGYGPQWSGGAQLLWRPQPPVDKPARDWPSLQLPLEAPRAGTYEVTLFLTGAPDYGRVRVLLRGKEVGDYAGYAPGVSLRSFSLGRLKLQGGANPLTLVVFGKEDAASNYFVGLDRILLQPATPK